MRVTNNKRARETNTHESKWGQLLHLLGLADGRTAATKRNLTAEMFGNDIFLIAAMLKEVRKAEVKDAEIALELMILRHPDLWKANESEFVAKKELLREAADRMLSYGCPTSSVFSPVDNVNPTNTPIKTLYRDILEIQAAAGIAEWIHYMSTGQGSYKHHVTQLLLVPRVVRDYVLPKLYKDGDKDCIRRLFTTIVDVYKETEGCVRERMLNCMEVIFPNVVQAGPKTVEQVREILHRNDDIPRLVKYVVNANASAWTLRALDVLLRDITGTANLVGPEDDRYMEHTKILIAHAERCPGIEPEEAQVWASRHVHSYYDHWQDQISMEMMDDHLKWAVEKKLPSVQRYLRWLISARADE